MSGNIGANPDLLYRQVQEDIISDISRVIVSPTTHFIHIIQQRTRINTPSFGQVKFLERDASDISTYVKCLEELSSFPSIFHKKSICIEVLGEIMSTYTFNVYSFDNWLIWQFYCLMVSSLCIYFTNISFIPIAVSQCRQQTHIQLQAGTISQRIWYERYRCFRSQTSR